MCDRKALVVERILNRQLEKRIVLLTHCYEQVLENERSIASDYNERAVEYWRIVLRLRKKLAILAGEIEEVL